MMLIALVLCLFLRATQQIPDYCLKDVESGPCRALHSRYYYDSVGKACYNFKYGGCGGNENNFPTKEECESRCMDGHITGVRLPAIISKSKADDDTCTKNKEVGDCKAMLSKYYYDVTSGVCTHFYYGGCGGNDNRFDTKEECEARCKSGTQDTRQGIVLDTSKAKSCLKEPVTGMCRASLTRYFYDQITGQCSTFVYGGCGGNENNFLTLEDCQSTCAGINVRTQLRTGDGRNSAVVTSYDVMLTRLVVICVAGMVVSQTKWTYFI